MFERPKPLGGVYDPRFFGVLFLISGTLHGIDGFTHAPVSWSRVAIGGLYVTLAAVMLLKPLFTRAETPSEQEPR